MSDPAGDAKDRLYDIGSILRTRLYDRQQLPEESQEPELSPVEYVFLSVFDFWVQIHINGFDGFLANTDGEYLNFLPIALAAVGAKRSSDIVRKSHGAYPDESGFDEDYGTLLLAYAQSHRDELPDPSEADPERLRAAEEQRERWREERWKKMAEARSKEEEARKYFLSRARVGDLSDVKEAIEEDPSIVYAKDRHTEQTALHLAARHGHTEVVRLLIERRADVSAQAIERYSPLTAALWAVGNPYRGTTDEKQLRIAEMIRKAGGR